MASATLFYTESTRLDAHTARPVASWRTVVPAVLAIALSFDAGTLMVSVAMR